MSIVKVITRLPRVPSSGTRLQPTQHSFASADNNSGVYDREASAAESQCWNVVRFETLPGWVIPRCRKNRTLCYFVFEEIYALKENYSKEKD